MALLGARIRRPFIQAFVDQTLGDLQLRAKVDVILHLHLHLHLAVMAHEGRSEHLGLADAGIVLLLQQRRFAFFGDRVALEPLDLVAQRHGKAHDLADHLVHQQVLRLGLV